MSGIDFGLELKKLRQQKQISSKVLSKKVGKAVTYVSQLERGLIKNPDFNTCFNLMKEIGFDEQNIEGILNYFGIRSPEREAAELERMIQEAEKEQEWERQHPTEYSEWQMQKYLDSLTFELKDINQTINRRFSSLIERNVEKAEVLLKAIEDFTSSPKAFDFFCALLENKFLSLTDVNKSELLALIQRFIHDKTKHVREE